MIDKSIYLFEKIKLTHAVNNQTIWNFQNVRSAVEWISSIEKIILVQQTIIVSHTHSRWGQKRLKISHFINWNISTTIYAIQWARIQLGTHNAVLCDIIKKETKNPIENFQSLMANKNNNKSQYFVYLWARENDLATQDFATSSSYLAFDYGRFWYCLRYKQYTMHFICQSIT